ncbi:MFS peptide transporter [Penicillium waksmanii]|uniref:MFS peptide transporter n=1 Tax=Penicillium waksmanii TaxID=69791 RepID=UPI002546B6EB|nr:MFS peptide transporter [Penicillium waksmanii]KAJ5983056.1 MFS peptide transporter [Penicillium waksmanii]
MASPRAGSNEGFEIDSLQSTYGRVVPLVPPSDEKKPVDPSMSEANSDPLEDHRRDSLPLASYSLCLVEFAERASYYGARTVFANFIEFPLPKAQGGNGAGAPPRGTQKTAGALGMGLQASSSLNLLFSFLAYVIPILGGWWADVHIGWYKAIMVGVLICGLAHIVQLVGVIPSVLQKGASHAAPPFIVDLLFLALGAGIFKPNIAPTWQVYKQSPCGYSASTCDEVAPISIWWQLPATILGALSECFCNVTAYEVAYSRSPKSMRSTVVASFLFMSALSSALEESLIPVTKDPWLIWIWAGLAIALILQIMIFWYRFRHINNESYATTTADATEEKAKDGTSV